MTESCPSNPLLKAPDVRALYVLDQLLTMYDAEFATERQWRAAGRTMDPPVRVKASKLVDKGAVEQIVVLKKEATSEKPAVLQVYYRPR